ncbi:MAG: hypothetical protein AB1742_14370, partial [bacterium]
MTLTASSDGEWYLCLRSYNGCNPAPCTPYIGGDVVYGPFKREFTAPTAGTVTPSNVTYLTTHVDSPFDLTTGFTDSGANSSGVASCEYTLNGLTWNAAAWGGVNCTASPTCADGQALTLNMRATDNAGNVGTATAVATYSCDTVAPTMYSVAPAALTYSSTAVTSGATSCNDDGGLANSGLKTSGAYDVQYCDSGTTSGNCTAASVWLDNNPVGYSTTNTESFTGTDGRYYSFRARCKDNVDNVASWIYSPNYILVDGAAPTAGTVTPASTDSGTHVDATFNLSTTFSDGTGSGVASCQYCKSIDGICDTEWAAGTWSAGTCSVNGITCTDGQALTLNMRATDNVGYTGTATAVGRTCDTVAPATTDNWTDNWTNVSPVNITLSPSDGRSGVQATYYCIDTLNTCSPTTLGTAPSVTCAAGSVCTQYVRYYSIDNVNNAESPVNSKQVRQDRTNPAGGSILYTGGWYLTTLSVTMTLASGADTGSGIAGVQVQRRSAAFNAGTPDCGAFGVWGNVGTQLISDVSYTDNTILDGNCYQYRYNVTDNTGNVTTYCTDGTACAAPNTVKADTRGAYLQVNVIDAYAGDDPDGVLKPDGAQIERVYVRVYGADDAVKSNSGAQVTVTLGGGAAAAGTVISATSLGAPTATGTASITGNLVNGEAYVDVTATAAATAAVTVTAAPTGLAMTEISGRNQVDTIIVAGDTTADIGVKGIGTVYDTASASRIVHNPVWSHAGDKVAYLACTNVSCDDWNVYVSAYSGGAWATATRVTSDVMDVKAFSRITWSTDDTYIIFTAQDAAQSPPDNELAAVVASGADNAKTLAQLDAEDKLLTHTMRKWMDPDFARSSCVSGYQGRMLASVSRFQGIKIVMLSGTANSLGLFEEGVSTITTVIDLTGHTLAAAMNPRWSPDCSKIVFSYWDNSANWTAARIGIYVLNLTDTSFDLDTWSGATVTTITDAAITKIHECHNTYGCANGPAFYPSFSADGTMVSYMASTAFNDITKLIGQDDVVTQFYSGTNLDNYLEYIFDQPTYAPQLIGESANNETSLVQCIGASCPVSAVGKPFVYVTQKSGSTEGDLQMLTLDNESTIRTSGGLLFYKGAVAAVFPAGAVNSETLIQVSDPGAPAAGACGGYNVDCQDLLVSTGEAREFYPTGIDFNKDVRLIFHYNDVDNDGIVDSTSYDENKLYVYYWCDTGANARIGCTENTWVKLDGVIDKDNNYIVVATNHFSLYDVKALTRGRIAPQTVDPIILVNPHTFPNPRRPGDGDVNFGVDNDATQVAGFTGATISIRIYDLRG